MRGEETKGVGMKKKVSILCCGYAKGKKSAQLECYYFGKSNKFWDVLHEVGLTPGKIKAEEYNRLTDFGMELTDIVKDQNGNDNEIEPTDEDIQRLCEEIREQNPSILAFNGKKAAKTFLYKKLTTACRKRR